MADNEELAPIGGASDATVGAVGEPAPAPAEERAPAVKYRYLADENPDGASFQGVPLADLTEEQVAAYPKWLQRALKGAKYYEEVQ